jgi:hypothetical protein
MEIPNSTMKVINLSVNLNCLAEDSTPAQIPIREHIMKEVPARIRVAPNLSNTSSMTFLFRE